MQEILDKYGFNCFATYVFSNKTSLQRKLDFTADGRVVNTGT